MENRPRFMIGGPSRNGKTTITNTIYQNHAAVIGFPIECIFRTFYNRSYPLKRLQTKNILREYLFQERYLGPTRTQTARPIDFFRSDFDAILKQVPAGHYHQLQLIAVALDVFARDHGAYGWAACDVHHEALFGEFKKHIPGLHLVIMLRDPWEAICANFYTPCYPRRNARIRENLAFRTLMWRYSAEFYLYWKKRYPDNVSSFHLNDLIQGDPDECARMAGLFDIPENSVRKFFPEDRPHYTYENGKFLTPDGKMQELLREEEFGFIVHYTRPLIRELGWSSPALPDCKLVPSQDTTVFEKLLTQMQQIIHYSPEKALDFVMSRTAFTREKYYFTRKHHWKDELKRNLINLKRIFIPPCPPY